MKIITILIVFLLLQTANSHSATPTVISFSPARQILNASRGTDIIVDFDTPLNTSTVTGSTFRVFGKQSGPISGKLLFLNGNTRIKFTPSSLFLAGECVTVNLAKGIKSSDNTPLTTGFSWNFWTIAMPGTLNVTLIQTIPMRRPEEGHIQTYGALGVDINDDGWTDLSMVNEITKDLRIFLNNGGNFDTMYAVYSMPAGNRPSPSEAADFNNDGLVDVVVGSGHSNNVSVFIATGGGNFLPEAPYTAANFVGGVAINDFNGDGFDDILTGNRAGNNIALFRNKGDGTFDSAQFINTAGNGENGIMMADANNDGILDAFIACYSSSEIVLLLGDGNGNFTFSDREPMNGPPWSIAVGDINGDGNVDAASCLTGANMIGVVFGDGNGGLGTVANYNSSLFPLATDIGDVDGDGDLDLISSNTTGGNFNVFENNGSGIFTNTPIILPSVYAGSCITVHDRDNDGDLDLAGIDEVADLLFIFDNKPLTSVTKLNITAVPEGFYNPDLNTISRNDTFTVYLRNNFSPFSLVDSSRQVIDSVTQTGLFEFYNSPDDSYYAEIDHLNSIQTWSKSGGMYLTNDGTIYYYDFTSSDTQAYGNNLKSVSGKFCLFSGDVNKDGFINLADLIPVYNDGTNFITGNYLTTDVNGDSIVDLSDVTICNNNVINFVSVIRP